MNGPQDLSTLNPCQMLALVEAKAEWLQNVLKELNSALQDLEDIIDFIKGKLNCPPA